MSDPQETAVPGMGVGAGVAVERAAEELERDSSRFDLRGRTLREHVARGGLINALFMIALSALGFLKGFILAALLTREDYGIWGILVISLGTLLWLKQVGIGDKFVQQEDEDQEAAFQKAFTLELMLTGAATVVLAALVPLVAELYGQPDIVAPGLVLLLVLPAGILQAPLWVYYRRMDFFKQRALQAVDPVVAFVLAIVLAIAGAGYWALIVAAVAGAWAAALAAVVASPYRLRLRYDRGTLRSYASFSWPLLASTFGGMVIAQASVLTTEDAVGLAGAGALILASTITQFTDRVDALVTGTLYPAICAVADRRELLHESFVKSNRLALMWAIPFGVGVSLFADDLVRLALGAEWESSILLLQVFGVAAAAAHIGFNWNAYFRAIGRTFPMAVAASAAALVFVASVPLIYSRGLEGVAIAIAAQMAAHLAVRAWFLARLFRGFALARHALRAVLPTLPAVGVVLAVRALGPDERTLPLAIAELALYLVVTAGFTWLFERSLLREAAGYVRRGARRAPDPVRA